MTAQPGNVRPLHPTPAAAALAEARAMPPDHLDAILDAEALQPANPAADAWQALIDRGDAIQLTDATRERDQARTLAVTLEQQLGEIDRLAEKWSRLQGLPGGIGRTILDITRGQRGDDPAA